MYQFFEDNYGMVIIGNDEVHFILDKKYMTFDDPEYESEEHILLNFYSFGMFKDVENLLSLNEPKFIGTPDLKSKIERFPNSQIMAKSESEKSRLEKLGYNVSRVFEPREDPMYPPNIQALLHGTIEDCQKYKYIKDDHHCIRNPDGKEKIKMILGQGLPSIVNINERNQDVWMDVFDKSCIYLCVANHTEKFRHANPDLKYIDQTINEILINKNDREFYVKDDLEKEYLTHLGFQTDDGEHYYLL